MTSSIALQKGSKDPRAKSFLHLITILPQLSKKPNYILIENVVGFEVFFIFIFMFIFIFIIFLF